MEQTKLNKSYDTIINSSDIITERTFLINGISNPEEVITMLLDNGTLKVVEPGKYQISSATELYNYGVTLLKSNYQLRANLCFEKCYQVNPKHRNSALQVLLLKVKSQKYQEAYNILDDVLEVEPEKYQYDNNLYLYLLNILEKCPEKYNNKVKSLVAKSVISSENTNEEDIEMRKEIISNHFSHAMYFLNNIRAKNLNYSIEIILLKVLLSKAIDNEKNIKEQLELLVKHNQYQELLSILNELQRRTLNYYMDVIYLLTQKIIEISETRIIPVIKESKTNDLYQAVLNNNFSLAKQINDLKINSSRVKLLNDKNINKDPKETKIIDKLLVKIDSLIKEIKESELSSPNETVESSNQSSLVQVKLNEEKYDYDDKEMKSLEELAYYLKELKFPFDLSCKKIGLLPEQILLVKLIYARDYYLEGETELGDKLLHEVEISLNITNKVTNMLNELKTKRNQRVTNTHVRTRKKITISNN